MIEETWALSTRRAVYAARPADTMEAAQLANIHGTLEFEALSVGGPQGQAAIIPLDESSEERGRLVAAAPKMARMLLSMTAHVSHGGPTREEAEALLREAGVL